MNWDEYYGRILHDVASKSPDNSSQFGGVIVDSHYRLRATGYNGPPRGYELEPSQYVAPEKYLWMVHAEVNALYDAARAGVSTDGCSIYVITVPCLPCMIALHQAGIQQVVYFNEPPPQDGKTWRDTIGKAAQFAYAVGILLRRGGDR